MKTLWESIKNYIAKRKNNYAFWISFASAVLMFLTSIGVTINNDTVMKIIKTALGILIALGIINDPTTNHTGYADDSTKKTNIP